MHTRFVVSRHDDILYCGLLDEKDRLLELHLSSRKTQKILGNIYIGKVANVVPTINAVFVNIGIDQDIFLQLEENTHYIYTNQKERHELPRIGDEMLIQITKEAYMFKAPTGSNRISFPGKYCILTYDKSFVGLSSKITDKKERERLKSIFQPYVSSDYGFIVRTNAKEVPNDILEMEIQALIHDYEKLMATVKYKIRYQCVYKEPDLTIQLIRDLYQENMVECVFDDKTIYEDAKAFFDKPVYKEITDKFRLYTDTTYSLYKGYSIEKKLKKALRENVHLKSGATIVIQPTEALTVIDVNSSKNIGKRNQRSANAFFRVNKEAAEEIARQIRLRNISGIIIIDFIDMDDAIQKESLLKYLRQLVSEDRIKTQVIDMTPLGLVEMTRKKIGKSLKEVYQSL